MAWCEKENSKSGLMRWDGNIYEKDNSYSNSGNPAFTGLENT